MDPRWKTFEGFLAQPPGGEWFPGAALCRNGDVGDYSPENARWDTRSANSREAAERRMTVLPDGRLAFDIAKAHGIRQSTYRMRVSLLGWDLERAVTTPVQRHRRAS